MSDPSLQPVTTLRGARVEVDGGRAGRVVLVICLLGLFVFAIALFISGANKNSQITVLRSQGVRVDVTVSKCLGLLGGSGTNAAGYACRGTFTFSQHRYDVSIPGDTLREPGSKVLAVSVPSNPGLITTETELENEHPSGRVFVLPTVLLGAFCVLVAVFSLRRRFRKAPSVS